MSRLLLRELGFQAGQHEIIEEAYGKTRQEKMKQMEREAKKEIAKCKIDTKKLEKNLNTSEQHYHQLKSRYYQAHNAMESAANNLRNSEEDTSNSRNDVEIARNIMDQKNQECQEMKQAYAAQVVKTNQEKEKYYFTFLPAVLNRFMRIKYHVTQFQVARNAKKQH